MNRMDFLAELERLLAGMPEEERQAALQYYADYFEDAGAENEPQVISELGSPRKVAESIKADYYGTDFDEAAFDRKNYMEKYGQRSSAGSDGPEGAAGESARGGTQGSGQYAGAQESGQYAGTQESGQYDGTADAQSGKPWSSNVLKILLIILIVIVAGPVALGIAGTLLGIVIAAVCLFAALVLASVTLAAVGASVAAAGCALMFVVPPAALVVTGTGILVLVLGMMATAGTVKLCIVIYPAMLRGFVGLCRRPFYGKAV